MIRACLSPSEIEKTLKEAGIQPTAQRIAICRYVLCEADHPTADQVKEWADANFPKISLATVYNTLNILVKAKLLREFRFPHTDKSVYDNNLSTHHHFYDTKSETLMDIPLDMVSIEPNLSSDFQIDEIEVLLKGKRN